MKKIMLTCALVILAGIVGHSQNTKDTFTLKGKITGQDGGKVYLYYQHKNGKSGKDSAVLNKGAFTFRGSISEPTQAYFQGNVKSMAMDDPNSTSFYIEPAAMTITLTVDDFKHAVLTGCKTQDESVVLEKSKQSIYDEMKPLNIAYAKAGDDYRAAVKNKEPQAVIDSLNEKGAAIHDQFDPFQQRLGEINFRFFKDHPNSYVTASMLQYYTGTLPLDT